MSTFQQLRARYDRPGSDSLHAEQQAMTDMIRAGRPRIRSQAEMDMERHERDLDRRQADLDVRTATLDQGSRGAAHAPEPKPTMTDLLRGMRNGGE